MPQPCLVCNHGDRVKLDRALLQKRSLTQLSSRYNVSQSSLKRHRSAHLDNGVKKPTAGSADLEFDALYKQWSKRVKLDTPEGVLDFAKLQMYRLERFVDRAEADGDLRTAVAAINSTLKTVTDLFAKTQGLIGDAPRIDQSTKVFAVLGSLSEDELRAYITQGVTLALPTSAETQVS